MRILKLLLIALTALILSGAVAFYGFYRGWHIESMEWTTLADNLEAGFEEYLPQGSGPFPTVVGFHGCSGMLEGNRDWARYLAANGFAVVLVDSMSFRQLDWQTVCGGKALWGNERVGDVFAAIRRIRERAFVDSDRLFLMGWSHGGWAVMDALYSDGINALPANLKAVPPRVFAGVRSAVIFYPFCEFPALSRDGWQHPVSSYFIFAENDSIVSNAACQSVIDKLSDSQQQVSSYTYADLDHAFDMRTSDFYAGTLQNDAPATADVHRRVLAYLKRHL